ncbi:C-type lectin domain family 4 member A [Rousettus aegyptiacus]|uniref:C-type lectin domain family 4 member A n=1 Tax=Rousettus aegyptiacus TaxID=9407 RepID=A0A7J8JD33_ROUAE|nr:C-type lectin domain family 4 member A [Rousettus aegyptiacus]XP_015976812.2 C-type lectin domain family 4 member A [Rousettus aegyptiacus]KAF6494269.1 C-type lectin domain family 4 member A [Rousettus aegyptiacus]
MTSEITYAEVRFKNESEASGTKSEPLAALKEKTSPQGSNFSYSKVLFLSLLTLLLLLAISFVIAFIIFFQKYSQLLKEKKTLTELTHTALECMKENLTMEGKDWTCCPKNWKSFSLNCYFISTEGKNWVESEKNCSGMKAHLLVINSKDEQDFITEKLNKKAAYFMGLSDPEGTRDWQWVDQTPYNKNATFWHRGEPSSPDERCVILNAPVRQWGWNDVPCDNIQMSICKMRKIFL